MTIKATRSKSRWIGALEGMHNGLLYGWALDTAQPAARVVLEICQDGDVIGCVIADMARKDLAETFGELSRDCCHGFVADLGMPHGDMSGVLTARIANTDCPLDGYLDRRAPPPPPRPATHNVFGDGSLRLYGWAFDPSNPQRKVTVRAYIDAKMVAQTMADLEHPALRGQNVGPHGFDLDLPMYLADGTLHEVRILDDDGKELIGSPQMVCCYANGVKALLPPSRDGLVQELADNYERFMPRSIGMRQYPHWRQHFEVPSKVPPSALRVALIIAPGGETQAIQRTADSLRKQLGGAAKVFGAERTGCTFVDLLALALQSGADAIGCVRAGDTLAPHAVGYALEGFSLPGSQVVYTDSEFQNVPWFKPAWDQDYAFASDYPLELMLVRATLARKLALAENPAEFCWQALSASVHLSGAIVHIPRVLYQFQSAPSTMELEQRAAAAAAVLRGIDPTATLVPISSRPTGYAFAARRVQRCLTPAQRDTSVSLIIPTRDSADLLQRCISSLQRHTAWERLEIIVIDNGSVEKETTSYFRKLVKAGVKVLPMPGPFNYADLNNRAIATAGGDVVALVNNDIEALHDGWIDEIMAQLLRPGVGAVGAKLLWPNGMVQHGGVLLGVGNVAGHYGNRLADGDWGDHGRNQLVQQLSGVTAACLFMRKADYVALGGMDPVAFPVAFNDVDLCLRLRAAGKAIVWTPDAKLLHAESASRGNEDTPQKKARAAREVAQLRQRWSYALLHDPAYHPALNLDAHSQPFGGLALPPRSRRPRQQGLPTQAPT